jgi:hypothetical protein
VTDFLYRLLPAMYRQWDLPDMPLRALCAILQEQHDLIEADIAALYDNWFVETCEPWVLPYIAELVGASRVARNVRAGADHRGFVANTLAYRRRKGTPAAIERAIEDATGWPARVVAFGDLLATAATVQRPRTDAPGTIAIRDAWSLARLGGAFDTATRTPDMRVGGRFNSRRVGLFVWRLRSYPVRRVVAASLGEDRHTFHPLGFDMPLFNRRVGAASVDQRNRMRDVPLPLTRRLLAVERAAPPTRRPRGGSFLNDRPAFAIAWSDGTPVPADAIAIADLATWRWPRNTAAAAQIAVDPERGRILARGRSRHVGLVTDHCYGFAADIGGGPYSAPGRVARDGAVWRGHVRADGRDPGGPGAITLGPLPEWPPEGAGGVRVPIIGSAMVPLYTSLDEALVHFASQSQPGLIEILDSATYHPANAAWAIALARDGVRLTIRAAAHQRPCLVGAIEVAATAGDAGVSLEGLLIGGSIRTRGQFALTLRHCTVAAPQRYSALSADPRDSAGLRVVIASSLVGPLRVPATAERLTITDSIIDGGRHRAVAAPSIAGARGRVDDLAHAGPPVTVARASMLGGVVAARIEATDTIFAQPVRVAHDHIGFMRHCYVPDGSRTPPQFACPVGPAVAAATRDGIRPLFTSLRLGAPGYGQLAPDCPVAISRGASDGGEIGAFHGLADDRRADDLDEVIGEQLPFGFDPITIYAT